jgi:RNA polymerase sigma factor (sigma-70 family)
LNFEPILKGIFAKKSIDTPLEYKCVTSVCDVVYSKHFRHQTRHHEDLIQEALLGVVELVQRGDFDPQYAATPYLYTRIRNQMSNFLNKKTPDLVDSEEDNYIFDQESDGCEQNEQLITRVQEYVGDRMEEWELSDSLKLYIAIYFLDKFGVLAPPPGPTSVTQDFVTSYDFYISALEFEIAEKFSLGNVFANKIIDVFDILDHEGDIPLSLKLMTDVFGDKFIIKLIYILSGQNVKFPSKMKLYRTDHNLSIYKNINRGKFNIEQASKFYKKTIDVIRQVVKTYDKVFKDL